MTAEESNQVSIGTSLKRCLDSSFPPATLHLLKELVKTEPNFDEIAKTIKLDPGLAATVLGLVNSPFYALPQHVTDLKKAAVVLGTRELLKTTLTASFVGAMCSLSPGKQAFPTWRVMVWSAIASEAIAERICPKDQERVYLCALLKDLSLLLLSSQSDAPMPKSIDDSAINCLQQGQLKEELELWGRSHAELTLEIFEALDLSGLACDVILDHHNLENLDSLAPQAKAIALGTRWSELTGTCNGEPHHLIRFESMVKNALELSDDEIEAMRKRILEKFRSMIGTLGIEEASPDKRLYDLTIQDLQKFYFQSMDLVGASGGLAGVAESVARHMRWNFGVSQLEIMLREPMSNGMLLFKANKTGLQHADGPAPADAINWNMHGGRYPIATEDETWGELRVGKKTLPQHELRAYVRFIAQAYEEYCLRQSVLEMKANTLDNLPVGVARLDEKGQTLQVNRSLAEFLRISPSDKDVTRYLPVSRFMGAEQEWANFLAKKDKRDFKRIFCADGVLEGDPQDRDRCLYFSASKRELSGREEILLLAEDITEVSKLEIQALKQREFLEKLVDSMHDVVMTVDHTGIIGYASPHLPESIVGKSLFEVATAVGVIREVWGPSYLDVSHEPVETVMLTGNRELKPYELVISPLKHNLGEHKSFLVVGRDLSTIRRLEEKLKRQAMHDGLTQLFNHDYFHTLLEREMKRLERVDRGKPAIVFIDLDRFKAINDEQGHQVGDDALRHVAKAIKNNIRAGMDYPCRYGGDEFTLILTEVETEGLHRFAARLKKGINDCWKEHISVSIGVAMHRDGDSAASLLKRADLASYQAKGSGGDTVVFAD